MGKGLAWVQDVVPLPLPIPMQTHGPNPMGMKTPAIHYLNPADIKSIQCVVGHIEDHGEWGLVDHSGLLAHVVFTEVD